MNILIATGTRVLFDAVCVNLRGSAGIDDVVCANGIGEVFIKLSKRDFGACLLDLDLPGARIVLPDLATHWPAMRVVGMGHAPPDHPTTRTLRVDFLERHATATEVAGRLTAGTPLGEAHRPRPADGAGDADAEAPLSLREHQIARLLAQGLSNKGIARELSIRPSTVKNHVHNILDKLAVSNRAKVAGRLGFLTLRPD